MRNDAYLAGIIDADGSIGLMKVRHTYFRVSVQVSSTDEVLVAWIKDNYGGSYTKYIPKRERCRPQFRYLATGKAAREILSLIEKHLLIKRQRAVKCLEFFALQDEGREDGSYYSDRQRQQFDRIVQWLKDNANSRRAPDNQRK